MTGVYSIAEVVDDSNKRPEKTIFCILLKDDETDVARQPRGMYCRLSTKTFNNAQYKSLDKVGKMVENNGGKYFSSLEEVAKFLNGGE